MANKKTQEFIEELSDTQINSLAQIQMGVPIGVINEATIASLDERDLLTRIQFTSPRSTLSIPGWALSEDGNKIVEELKRRHREQELLNQGVPPELTKADHKKVADKVEDGDQAYTKAETPKEKNTSKKK